MAVWSRMVKIVEYQHDWFGLFADSLAPGSVVVRAEAGIGVSECLRHRVPRLGQVRR
jgi:hypothetical protein